MSLILAIMVCLQEPPERLVEKLRTESVEERARAIQTLTDWGDKARPALEKATGDPDKEVADRAREILAAIDARKAQAEFRKMEEALDAAKTLRIRYRTELIEDVDRVLRKASGTLLFATEGRVLCLSRAKEDARRLFVSDGRQMYWSCRQAPEEHTGSGDAVPDLSRRLRRLLLTDGPDVLFPMALSKDAKEIEKLLEPMVLSMKSSGVDGPAGTLTFEVMADGRVIRGTYWVDPKTSAPLRCVLRWLENDRPQSYTTIYEEISASGTISDEAFELEAWKAGLKNSVRRLPGLDAVQDGGELDTSAPAYGSLLDYLRRASPERLAHEAWSPGYPLLAERSEKIRGSAIRMKVHFLQSNPIRLEKKIGDVEWVHRTYLCDASGQEGYVVDLLEAPPALNKKDRVQLEAVFLRMGEYEGQKGPVRAPFLLGQRLAAVPDK